MKKQAFPVAVLAIALIVVLGGIGVAYGAWSQNLTADVTVNTATFSVIWDPATALEVLDGAQSCTLAGVGTAALTLAANNAYPDHVCGILATIKNNSTIPVVVEKPIFTSTETWLTGADTYGLAPYTIAAGGTLPTHSLVLFVSDAAPKTGASATAAWTLNAHQ